MIDQVNILINNYQVEMFYQYKDKLKIKVFLMSFFMFDNFFVDCFVEDLKVYMKQFLEKLKDVRMVQRNYLCIFDDSNVRFLFGMLDVIGKGFIMYEQYK